MSKRMILLISIVVFAGCSPARQITIDVSAENIKNAETLLEVSRKCVTAWPVESGFIEGALSSRMDELPNDVVKAKEQLDLLAEKEELSDYELGLFLGLKVRLLNSVVQATLEKYTPNVIDILPLVF